MKVLKWFICLLCWVLMPPLFYYLVKRWSLMSKKIRIWMLVLSPIFLFFYLLFFVVIIPLGVEYYIAHRYDCRSNVERMIKVEMPRYKAIKHETLGTPGHHHFTTIMFKKLPPEEFYSSLDSMCNVKGSGWNCAKYYKDRDTVTVYNFSTSWQGDRFVERWDFSIRIIKNEKEAHISQCDRR